MVKPFSTNEKAVTETALPFHYIGPLFLWGALLYNRGKEHCPGEIRTIFPQCPARSVFGRKEERSVDVGEVFGITIVSA